jgi:aminopeptidase N
MKCIAFVASLLALTTTVHAQQNYWQQQLSYDIKATLNDKENTITATQSMVYKNNAPETLDFIWFHIWPNAYKNDQTALMRQIKNDTTRKKKAENFGVGYIDGLNFKVNGVVAKTAPHSNPDYIDIIKVILPKPLKSGDSVTITTPFNVQLPPYFSRSGFADGEFMACQWYPKPAVYDKAGWHEFPYLDMGEFYSEYADFSVSLTVPAAYVVGATGILQNKEELAQLKSIGAQNAANRNSKPVLYTVKTKDAVKTLLYKASNVPDFAWFADKGFVVQYDTVQLHTGKVVDAFSFYHNKDSSIWNNSIDYVEDAVKSYSAWVGEYAYPVVQAVEGPKNNSSGGMEYPMITLITSPDARVESLDGVIAHEVGHNWFMSMLGSNERMHTWMDEGLNTYYQFRYEAEKYKSNSIFGDAIPAEIKKMPVDKFQGIIYNVIDENVPMQAAMDIPADKFTSTEEYGIVSYVKTALWMYMLEASVGRAKVDEAVQLYFKNWQHKHPQPADMRASFEAAIGTDLGKFFELTKKEGKLH